MRVGYDSVNPVGCPGDGDIYMGYVDGNYAASYPGMKERFPGKTYISITVKSDGDAVMADVEGSDLTPGDAAAWVKLRRNLGHPYPVVYCSYSDVPNVLLACRQQGVAMPVYFGVAHTGQGPVFDPAPAGAVFLTKQYEQNVPFNGSSYDKSSVVDYWPGVDLPKPAPPKPKPVPVPEDEDMASMVLYNVDPTTEPVGADPVGVWVHFPMTGVYLHVEPAIGAANNATAFQKGGASGPALITYAQHQALVAVSPNGAQS